MISTGLTLLMSYFLGALPFGYLIAKWHGIDIFQHGSGNIGATNIGRVLGKRFGILVFLLDFAKGALPVTAASWIGNRLSDDAGLVGPDGLRVGAGLAAFLGHLFPIYLRFRGGKGVATGAGVVSVLVPGPALGAFLIWVTVLCSTRIMSLASIAAVVVLCALRLAFIAAPFSPNNLTITLFCFVAAGLVTLRHWKNIHRLLQGTENRLQGGPAMFNLSKIIHVLAVGLWFGSTVFFTFFVALSLFRTFEAVAEKPVDERPIWLPLPKEYDQDLATRKEQGTRVAGAAVSPIFHWYYLIQGACGVLAAITALGWSRNDRNDKVARCRFLILLLALISVLVAWPLEQKVAALRDERNGRSEDWLRGHPATADVAKKTADVARAEFLRWHLYSLFLNLGTIMLVSIAMSLCAYLPARLTIETPPRS